MRTVRHALTASALAASLALAGCSGGDDPDDSDRADDTPAAGAPSSTGWIEVPRVEEIREAVESGAVVIDVRTPEEFAAGHLRGARNLDFMAPDFGEQVGELDPEGDYVLYCASGNRAGQAQQLMLDQGFTSVMNAGGYDALAGAGFPTRDPARK